MIILQTEAQNTKIDVKIEESTAWLNQKDVKTIKGEIDDGCI